jgi:DNA repair exonuclease SbcCD nuclease subunit
MTDGAGNRYLFVGDPHYVVSEEDDCKLLLKQIRTVVDSRGIGTIVWLGDLHHDHALVRAEAISFWFNAFFKELGDVRNIVLVGNHDMPHDAMSNRKHAMIAYKDRSPSVVVVDRQIERNGVMYLPYIHDKLSFLEQCAGSNLPTVVCHQTIEGAKIGNEFFPDGVSRESIPQKHVISGHIHMAQELGGERTTTYVGSPRWRDMNDANIPKHLMVADLVNGEFVNRVNIPSECQPILRFLVSEEQPAPEAPKFGRVIYDVVGRRQFVNEMSEKLSSPGVRVRATITEASAPRVKESNDVVGEIKTYIDASSPPLGSSPEALKAELERLIYG